MDAIAPEIKGWWRIVETGAWVKDDLDDLGPALLSLTGSGGKWRRWYLPGYLSDARGQSPTPLTTGGSPVGYGGGYSTTNVPAPSVGLRTVCRPPGQWT
jgi:hypothetical protein